MKRPELKTSKNGSRYLLVFYSGNRYDKAIREAEQQLGVAGEKIAALALPIKSGAKYSRTGKD